MRRGTKLAALLCGGAIVLTMGGVVVAESPSPDPSSSAAASQEPSASVSVAPSAAPSEPAVPSVGPSAAPNAAPSVVPKSAATPKPAEAAETPDADEVVTTLKGVLTTKKDAEGEVDYYIGDVQLSVGPPWFWGAKHPLVGLVGQAITMTGHMETGNPVKAKAKANATAKDAGPEFEVLTVNGKTIREPGKPPWAGGPKVVGPSHPGYAGWSKNHGNGNGNGAKASTKP